MTVLRAVPLEVPRLFCLVSDTDDLSLLPALAEAGTDGLDHRAAERDERAGRPALGPDLELSLIHI